jgi:nitroreductase
MSLQELILSSRSYRSFDPNVRISREELASFVECARLSPSSRNLQVLKFRLVHTAEECDRVLPLTRWAGLIKDETIPPVGHAPTAYVVICFDSTLADSPVPFQRDVGICAQSIMLAATEQGFGGCMIGSFHQANLQEALALPSHLAPQLVLALGKPDETVKLCDAKSENVAYYRANGTHYVPKRALEEIIF